MTLAFFAGGGQTQTPAPTQIPEEAPKVLVAGVAFVGLVQADDAAGFMVRDLPAWITGLYFTAFTCA